MCADDGTEEMIKEFLIESQENLDRMDRDLVQLEKDPFSKEALASVFRTIHTIKGTCGFLGFGKLEALAHAGESLLCRLRDEELELDASIASALLAMVDAIRGMLAVIESSGAEGEDDASSLITTLKTLQAGESAGVTTAPSLPASAVTPAVYAAQARVPTTAASIPAAAAMVAAATPAAAIAAISTPAAAVSTSAAASVPTSAPAAAPAGAASGFDAARSAGDGKGSSVSDAHVRVNVELLDSLMNMVGELVLVRNQIIQLVPQIPHQGLSITAQRLSFITTELQGEVMKTRMQPIRNVWDKFPRVVRDLAVTCGKQIRLHMEGQDTELDKTIIEAIKDPMTHLVRNCVDHGIETKDRRSAAGKTAEGVLSLRAFHEGGQVIIEISDDGAGLDVDCIRRKAIERGLVSADAADRMTDQEFHGLIFLPGFSTAKTISNVSGRGVGMDVVKTNIERIGGSVDLQSRAGHGTTFRIKIPLTLAIVPALIVSSGGDRYAIPQSSLLELVRLDADDAEKAIEVIHGTPVYRLRGKLLPLVYLDRELRGGDARGDGSAQTVNIVVLHADERSFGLVVHAISDTQEIVVKPLGQWLKGLTIFAGATIMGDGRVALILDVMGLAQRVGVVGESHGDRHADDGAPVDARKDRQSWLLFVTDDGRRMAIPLDQVARLEVWDRTRLERLGGRLVVQYRGEILPLCDLTAALPGGAGGNGVGGQTAAPSQNVDVVVYNERGRHVGLMVGKILDIVEDAVTVSVASPGDCQLGVARCGILRGMVTELPDLRGLFGEMVPGAHNSSSVEGLS